MQHHMNCAVLALSLMAISTTAHAGFYKAPATGALTEQMLPPQSSSGEPVYSSGGIEVTRAEAKALFVAGYSYEVEHPEYMDWGEVTCGEYVASLDLPALPTLDCGYVLRGEWRAGGISKDLPEADAAAAFVATRGFAVQQGHSIPADAD